MSSIGQHLVLVSGGNGDAVASGQWFGGKAYAFVSSTTNSFNVKIDISPDGGTTWFNVLDVTAGLKATFSAPALMVRVRGQGPATPQNLNVVLIGYDEAE